MNPLEKYRERTRAKLLSDLGAFCRRAWKEIEPGKELKWNWHHQLITEHLTLAYQGETTRLIFTQPPRSLKSKLISVLFPAWCWAQSPEQSFILTSYSDSLSEELNMARRTLLSSSWFQSTFPGKVQFSADQNRREQFRNLAGGVSIATSTEGTLTGKGADFLLVDDLLSPQQSYSDLERQNANRFFDSTLRSRLNEPETGRIIIVCQRLHEADLVGHLLENEPGVWTCINLAMECEADEEIEFPISGKILSRKAGDLLHPQRFSKTWCEKQKSTLGRLVWSSQYQQRPSPLEGNLVKANDIQFYGGRDWTTGVKDPDLPETFERTVVSVDCSFKDLSTSDYVCILVIGVNGSRRYVRHIVNARLSLDGTENEIRAAHANYAPVSAVLVEDKANGSAVIAHLKEEIAGLVAVNPEGGKVSRMMAAAPEFEANNWFFDRTGAWTNKAIDQLCLFPNSKNDDIADAVSQAAIWLQSHSYELSLLDVFKQRGTDWLKGIFSHKKKPTLGKAVAAMEEAKPVIVTCDQAKEYIAGHPPPLCPHPDCKHPNTFLQPDHEGNWRIVCKQCGRTDGRDVVKPIDGNLCWVPGCGLKLVMSGGNLRCQNHGQLPTPANPSVRSEPTNGCTKAQLKQYRLNRWRGIGQYALRSGPAKFPWSSSGRF